jgi:hypothetical protein
MKDSVRRIVMLCTILTFGLILVFFDVTLIQLLLMMVVLVIVLPFLLGSVTVAEVKAALLNMKGVGILRRLDNMKFFEKGTSTVKKAPPAPETAAPKPAKPEAPKSPGKSGGISARLKSMFSSFGSLKTILSEKSKRGKNVEDINKMLDKTVSEKVAKPPLPAATSGPGGGDSSGGGGAVAAGPGGEADPFLSLSGDEFDAGLLDGLDDEGDMSGPAPSSPGEPGSSLPEPELLMPSFDGMDESPAAPADAGSGIDEFSGLEGSGSLDEEFGDLDSMSLDDVELDEGEAGGMADASDSAEVPAGEAAAPAVPAATDSPGNPAIKTAWIPSDAPKGADMPEDQIGVQSDMASFAGGAGGTDEDLLSSIASDVKHVKKEKDVSLLRELKDFKAPATEIESELTDMYTKMGPLLKPKDKNPPAEGMK